MTRPILLFDGVCNLCNGAVQFVMRYDSTERFQFASLQSEAAQPYIKQAGLSTGYLASLLLIDESGRVHTGADAALAVGERIDAPWNWLATIGRMVPERLQEAAYRVVARNRYFVFGRKETCRIPTPDERARFLEHG